MSNIKNLNPSVNNTVVFSASKKWAMFEFLVTDMEFKENRI